MAVNVQNQTGGNLAEILTGLSRLLRNRSKINLKVRALSADGRMSAIVLSLIPFLFVTFTLGEELFPHLNIVKAYSEVLADEVSRQVKQGLSQPLSVLYPELTAAS